MTISCMSTRNRTPSKIIGYGLYLYFLELSFRNTAKALSFLLLVKINHVYQSGTGLKYRSWKHIKNKKIKEYIIDETMIKAGSELIWLCWIVIEPKHKEILSFNISKQRNMVVTERFLSKVVKEYVMYSVSSDGGTWYPPQACKF